MGTNLRRPLRLAAALLALAALAGCFNPFAPRVATVRGVSTPPPVPNSAVKVVELFAWCWNNRAYQEYSEIFTDDFRFQFSEVDTSGTGGRGEFLTREEELEVARHLFIEGTAAAPPATSITLDLDRNLIDEPDSRPGKHPKWHREISTNVTLRIQTDQDYQVTGRARFFLVRGDSALIPEDLEDRFRPDSTRWWIERWEDETSGGGTAARRPRVEWSEVTVSRTAGAAPRAERAQSFAVSWTRFKIAYLDR